MVMIQECEVCSQKKKSINIYLAFIFLFLISDCQWSRRLQWAGNSKMKKTSSSNSTHIWNP